VDGSLNYTRSEHLFTLAAEVASMLTQQLPADGSLVVGLSSFAYDIKFVIHDELKDSRPIGLHRQSVAVRRLRSPSADPLRACHLPRQTEPAGAARAQQVAGLPEARIRGPAHRP
jgi:hypothetical protein